MENHFQFHNQDLTKFLQGVIWDMDGVLIDSMEIHFKIWQKVFLEYGVDFDRRNFNRHFGTTNLETITTVLGNRLSREESVALADHKQELFEQQAIREAQLIPGVKHWLQFFLQNRIPQAVASSNAQRFIELVSAHLGIDIFFRAIISAENLASKPDPVVFLESARRIQAIPSHCLVFEDAVAGIKGARRAGMKCIAITTTNTPRVLAKADLIIRNFLDLTPDQLINVMEM
jgi:HAD superfamily hydrolase (TIGR01509 family)